MNQPHITDVIEATYEQEVLKSELAVLVDFWAPWCGPCMAMMPTIVALAEMYQDNLKIVKINADENKTLMESFGVRGIPALFLVKDGEVLGPVKARTRTRLAMEIDELLA